MTHLLRFRKGWQSEHLAKYILSKFSFIAEPTNISDDIGSDFFCTLFKVKSKEYLLPQSSFAIQIKSNKRKINISNKLDYFIDLELPYFIGIVIKSKQKITIYSGEAFPFFFSHFGNPSTIASNPQTFIVFKERRNNDNQYTFNNNTYEINFPKVTELDVEFDYENEAIKLREFSNILSVCQKNISARRSREYIFNLIGSNGVKIFAGSGSITTYKENFYKRLSEAFYNIEWKYKKIGGIIDNEFYIYEKAYLDLEELEGQLPFYLQNIYKKVKEYINIIDK